jgi:S1-C subfamily serine protease
MNLWLLMLLAVGQSGQVESEDFPADVQAACLQATVKVVNVTQGREGSGVVVKQQDQLVYVLTANHVVEKAEKLEVHVFSPKSYPKAAATYDGARVFAQAKEPDLAVLVFATRDTVPGVARLCTAKQVPTGTDFPGLTVGCSGGKAPTCATETVKGKKVIRRPGEGDTTAWELATPSAKGRSGGPLFDKRGLVIGIASGIGDGKGYYSHPEEIHRFLKRNDLANLAEEDGK